MKPSARNEVTAETIKYETFGPTPRTIGYCHPRRGCIECGAQNLEPKAPESSTSLLRPLEVPP